jgi:glyoxylase-like metal-dependent hydrolase (beta-lactamase superfamily II)
MHIDHYGGLSALQRHFPGARAIATPKSVELMPESEEEPAAATCFITKAGTPDTPDTPDAIEASKRYLTDFGRLKESPAHTTSSTMPWPARQESPIDQPSRASP